MESAHSPRLILAPLRGITGAVFRTTFAQHFEGFDGALAPFITTVSGNTVGRRHLRDILPESNTRMPVTPQLIGKCGEDFVRMAQWVAELGYHEINWNLGCPHPLVARKRRGSGLLPFPEDIRRFLDTVVERIPCRLSVKTRLGHSDPDDLWEVLEMLNDFPLSEVIVHPRTGVQMYEGGVDRARYGQALAQCRHPVVYNGDIAAPATLHELQVLFPSTAGWMIGRGAVYNPFLPAEVRGRPLPSSPARDIAAFHDDLYDRYRQVFSGPSPLLGAMKELWSYLAHGFVGGARFLKEVRKASHCQRYERVVRDFFTGEPVWAPENTSPEFTCR